MISRPSCTELIEAVRRELRATIGPAVTDVSVLGALEMIDSVLQNVSVRSEHELGWMREEIGEIETLAEELVQATNAPADEIGSRLVELQNARADGADAPDVRRQYHAASALLSRCSQEAVHRGGDVRARLDHVLQQRLARELIIRGEFRMAGRG